MTRFILPLLCLFALALTACQSEEVSISNVPATLKLSSTENSVWQQYVPRATTDTWDTYYVLDANGRCRTAASGKHSTPARGEKLLAIGDYNVFSITNAETSGLPFESSMIGTDFNSQPMVLNTLTDVCLGKQPLSIVASKSSYDVNVKVNHIMAKLAVTVSKVSNDIKSIAITLTNVSKTFYLNGTFDEDGTTQTLDLQKAATANADDTYEWSLPETLIYPCPTGATATALTIVATDNYGNESTYDTSSTTVCSSGTRTSLTTIWRTLTDHLSYGYTETPWTTTVQQGSFEM